LTIMVPDSSKDAGASSILARFGAFGAIVVIVLGIVGAVNAMLGNQFTGAGLCLLAAGLGSAAARLGAGSRATT
jgi:hypothetical protein